VGILLNASSTIIGNFNVVGDTRLSGNASTTGVFEVEGAHASTTGFLVVGTALDTLALSAGDLFVSDSATTTTYLEVGVVTDAQAGYAAGDLNVGNDLSIDGDLEIGGNVNTGAWQGTVVTATFGGSGVADPTDGAVLLGSGSSPFTPLAVTTAGQIIIGDGSGDPTVLTAFTSATGQLLHEQGGLEFDANAVAIGDIIAGTGAGTMALITSTGHADGDVLTRQADGSVDYETPAAGGGTNDWEFGIANLNNFIRPTTTVDLFFPSRVGIGTSTPQALLSVATSSGVILGTSLLFQVASTTPVGISNVLTVNADRLVAIPNGLLTVRQDGTALDANGSINLGATALDAGFRFDGSNLIIETQTASGIIIDSEDDTLEFAGSGVVQFTADLDGIDLIAGNDYEIAGNQVLDNNTLGALVVESSLTSVGALAGGSIVAGFGAIDNGTDLIRSGGIWTIDVDGTDIGAAGSLNFGLATNDAALFWIEIIDCPTKLCLTTN